MAIIKLAVVRIIINSSYVLISTTPFARLRNGWNHSPSCLGKYIIVKMRPAPGYRAYMNQRKRIINSTSYMARNRLLVPELLFGRRPLLQPFSVLHLRRFWLLESVQFLTIQSLILHLIVAQMAASCLYIRLFRKRILQRGFCYLQVRCSIIIFFLQGIIVFFQRSIF